MPSNTSKSNSGAKTAAKPPLPKSSQNGSKKTGKAAAKKAESKKSVKAKANPKAGVKSVQKTSQKTLKTNNRATTNPKRGKSMSENDKSNGDQKALDQLATDNSLETVRDILFGAQVKQANERDQQLEKLINTRADSLQKSLDAQMKSVENTIAKLADKLDKEAAQTATKVEQRFKQIEDLIKSTDSKTQASQQEMYDELVAERQALERDAKAWNEDLAKELENVHNQLKESKTDRLTLANLLTDMAASLIADPKTPAKK